jgi:hypothetical protein
MLSTSWTAAPAVPSGPGRADVRAHLVGCAAVRPDLQAAVVPVQGTGVPAAGSIARLRATGLFTTGMPVAQQFPPLAQQYLPTIQNDGTTLGIRSSRRPPS